MKKLILMAGLILGISVGMSACSTGEYNDLECDPSDYQAQCLGPNSYMYCKSGQLITVICGGDRLCKTEGGVVACKDPVSTADSHGVAE